MSQWLQRTNKIHLRCFWGSIYDQCDPSPLMVVSQFWSSGISWWQLWPFVDHKVGRKQVTTKWATSLQTLNGGSDNLDMETYFLFPFQMEDTIFLLNCELVADTCTQNSHSGCRHSQLLILLQVSSSSGFGSDSDHLLPKQSLCFHTLATGNCWFLSRVPNAGASPVPGPPCFSRARTAWAREPVIRGTITIIVNRCSDVVSISSMLIS